MMIPLHAAQARRRQIWRATVLLFAGLGGCLAALVFGKWMALPFVQVFRKPSEPRVSSGDPELPLPLD